VFGADLGTSSVGNRNILAGNFTTGLKNAAIKKARMDCGVVAATDTAAMADVTAATSESIRVAADALRCADQFDFLGQKSKETNNDRDVAFAERTGKTLKKRSFYSMPVKVSFEDRSSRIYFEQTLKEKCGVRAIMSLPTKVRSEMKKIQDEFKAANPDKIVNVRIDIKSLSFTTFLKNDGEPNWFKVDSRKIDALAVVAGAPPLLQGGGGSAYDGEDPIDMTQS